MVIMENKRTPGSIGGGKPEFIIISNALNAPCDSVFKVIKRFGDFIKNGEQVALVNNQPVLSQISGVVRGSLDDNLKVTKGNKIGEIDPSFQELIPEYSFTYPIMRE